LSFMLGVSSSPSTVHFVGDHRQPLIVSKGRK